MDKKFSGYIEYRNWNNEVNMVVRILAGKVVRVYNVSAAPNNDAAGIKTQGLKTNDVTCITYRIPASATVTTVNGTYYADYTGARYCTVCYSPSDDDNFTKNRPPMPPADWVPVSSVIGGGGGSTGGGRSITNNIQDSCMKAQVNNAISAGLNNYTSSIANYVFGGNTYFDLNFSQTINLPNKTDAETNCQGVPATQNYFVADVSLNANTLPAASKEYIAATTIHEILHAYWTYSGKLGEFNQHTDMANNYIYTMQSDLKAMFPNMPDFDAEALSWGGLSDTQAWKDMLKNDPDQANKIENINQQYKNATGTKGQRCH